jgi:hypothetical protein
MRFYTEQHQYYCCIDLHADAMYVCILDSVGEILVHRIIGGRSCFDFCVGYLLSLHSLYAQFHFL